MINDECKVRKECRKNAKKELKTTLKKVYSCPMNACDNLRILRKVTMKDLRDKATKRERAVNAKRKSLAIESVFFTDHDDEDEAEEDSIVFYDMHDSDSRWFYENYHLICT